MQFRNPGDNRVVRAGERTTHVPQCVLYSEIDNVTTINQGWDIAGVGWELNYPYAADGATVPPTGIRSAVPLGGMGTGNFELRCTTQPVYRRLPPVVAFAQTRSRALSSPSSLSFCLWLAVSHSLPLSLCLCACVLPSLLPPSLSL